MFVATGSSGYRLVTAAQGVPRVSVDYWAFAGPALLWAGAGLLIWRLTRRLAGSRPLLRGLARPVSGGLAGTVSGEKVVYRLGRGGALKVDAPGAVKTDANGKPLSPLDALRQEQKKDEQKKP